MQSRWAWVLGVLAVAVVATTCGRKSRGVLVAAPVAGSGVRIELLKAEADGDAIDIWLMASSDLDQEVVINRNQIAIVGPDGRDMFRKGGRELHRVKPRGQHKVHLDVDERGVDYGEAAGVYLRFDGVYVGEQRLNVPAMAIGQPAGAPGQAVAFNAPAQETRPAEKVKALVSPEEGVRQRAAAAHANLERYEGPRQQIKKGGAKCAAVPLKSSGVDDAITFVMDEILLTELQQSGFQAIGPDDINAMVGFESMKDATGCDDASCIAEIGNALGVEYLVAGNVASLDGSMVLTLKLIDVRGTRVAARVNRINDRGRSALPRMIAEAVQELIGRAAI